MNVAIRSERAADHQAITDVVRAAFADHPHSDQTEHLIVRSLRRHDVLTISLVAEAVQPAGSARTGPTVIGHIAFSPVTISDGTKQWFGLGPVAVLPTYQGQGIGSALVRKGIDRLASRSAQGCVLLGEPAYYSRFGFEASPTLTLAGAPPAYFMSRVLAGRDMPTGEVTYHAAFSVRA